MVLEPIPVVCKRMWRHFRFETNLADDQKAGQEAELVLALDGFAQVDGQRLCNDKGLGFVTQLIQRQQHWEKSCQVTNDGLSFR